MEPVRYGFHGQGIEHDSHGKEYTLQAPKSKALQDLYSVVESYPLHFLPQTGQRDLCPFVISTRIYREDET